MPNYKNIVKEDDWSNLLTEWSGFQASIASDWGSLLGLNPNAIVWHDLCEVADGLRLEFQSEQGIVWADLTGSQSTRLMVALRWQSDGMPVDLHGEVYSQVTKAQWSLCEPVVIDHLPMMVVSDHDWYDCLLTKIYNNDISTYIRNFYRLLSSPMHQFHLLEANHIASVTDSWRMHIPEIEQNPQLLDSTKAEMQFLNHVLPRHPDYCKEESSKVVFAQRQQLSRGV